MLSKNTKVLSLALFLVGIMGVFGVRVWQVKKARSIPFSPQESFFSLQPPSETLTGKLIKVEGEVKKGVYKVPSEGMRTMLQLQRGAKMGKL